MRVLIPTDGSECSYRAVRSFLKLARPGDLHIHLLNVLPMPSVGLETAFLQAEMEKDGLTAIIGARGLLDGYATSIEIEMREGSAPEIIVQIAIEKKVDLIVMGRHGSGRAREQVLGDTARGVVQNAACSILLGGG